MHPVAIALHYRISYPIAKSPCFGKGFFSF
uniref:Uncharacterized protein n=1 Tax=Myoviridae sp. ctj994 TaxID=2825160 RepID=A0A8S5NYD8_9CAUD|nr:MAG TPA: hypothetical protein [Myoviridae sp. ctj994]